MSVEKFIVTKASINYTIIPNKVLQELKCAEALGVWVYLASKPPSWEFYKDQIRDHFGIGRDKLDNIFDMLKHINLIEIKAIRSTNGRFTHWILHVKSGDEFISTIKKDPTINKSIQNTDFQGSGLPEYGLPVTGKPVSGLPVTGFSTPIKEIHTKEIFKENKDYKADVKKKYESKSLIKEFGSNWEPAKTAKEPAPLLKEFIHRKC